MLAIAFGVWSVFSAWSVNTQTPPNTSSITLNPHVSHQTMNGWEATAWARQYKEPPETVFGTSNANPVFELYKNSMYDMAVNDVGVNRLRLHVTPGYENTVGYFPMYMAGQITYQEFNKHRRQPVNDNSDPNALNDSGFQWAEMDYNIDKVVKPIRDRLLARGESLHLDVNFVTNDNASTFHKIPGEYAEFMLAVHQHMQQKHGFVPDTWEVVNEPDLTNATSGGAWTAQEIGQVIAVAGPRLAQGGFSVKFGTPSTAGAAASISWWDSMIAVPGVLPHIAEYVYHRYAPPTVSELNTIRDRAAKHGKTTSQLEIMGGNFTLLHDDLKHGNVSAWSHYVLGAPAGCCTTNYFTVDASNPNAPIVQVGTQTKFYRQYFKHVRKGAVRYEATTTNPNFDPLAFRNTDGRHVVVVKADASGAFSVGNLPAGTYGVFYTTGSPGGIMNYDVNLPDVVLPSAGSVTTSIPNRGVITIYGKTSGSGLSRPLPPTNLRILR